MVRKATQTDLEPLVVLFDNYRIFYGLPSDQNAARVFLHDRIINSESVIFVFENEANRITGFIQLYPIFSSTRMQRLWLLNDLFVDEKYRGTGCSRKLIERAQRFCYETNACGLLLETAVTNNLANLLYVRTGFTLDTKHNYYTWEAGDLRK